MDKEDGMAASVVVRMRRKVWRRQQWQGVARGGGDEEVGLVASVTGRRRAWWQGGGRRGDWDKETGTAVSVTMMMMRRA